MERREKVATAGETRSLTIFQKIHLGTIANRRNHKNTFIFYKTHFIDTITNTKIQKYIYFLRNTFKCIVYVIYLQKYKNAFRYHHKGAFIICTKYI